jgi:hypothetical protein
MEENMKITATEGKIFINGNEITNDMEIVYAVIEPLEEKYNISGYRIFIKEYELFVCAPTFNAIKWKDEDIITEKIEQISYDIEEHVNTILSGKFSVSFSPTRDVNRQRLSRLRQDY